MKGIGKLKTKYLIGLEDMEKEVVMMVEESYGGVFELRD